LSARVVNPPDLDGGDVVVQHVGADLFGAVERFAVELVIGSEMLLVLAAAGKRALSNHRLLRTQPEHRRLVRQDEPGTARKLAGGGELIPELRVLSRDDV